MSTLFSDEIWAVSPLNRLDVPAVVFAYDGFVPWFALLSAVALVAYANDGWLISVGIAACGLYAASIGGNYFLHPQSQALVILGAVIFVVDAAVKFGTIGYLFGKTARSLRAAFRRSNRELA
ncbi:hypothetical protein [Halorarum salinum]|uniref:hypothetical protein n=1 Tax=Halorarum salinum TaxID=2743089 RepID=UPI001C533D4C|nr:hypothetical protein [Halobaculum salinum]